MYVCYIMNTPAHILFLPAWYPHQEDSMYGLFIKKHADILCTKYKITVLYFAPVQKNNFSGLVVNRNGNLHEYIYYPKIKGKNIVSKILRMIEFLIAMFKNYNLIQNEIGKPDLVHVHVLTRMGYIAYRLKKKYGINYVITEHWSRYLPYPATYKGMARKYLTKKIVASAHEVTTVTKNLAEAMQMHGLLNKYSIINNVVDTQLFRIQKSEKHSKKTFIHISCFEDKSKNLTGLLKTIAILNKKRNDFDCVLIGEGIDFNVIKNLAKNLHLNNVLFTGLVEGKKLADYMATAHFLVVSSRYENFPVVIPEAFSCGLPVVATQVGGIAEWVNESNGILVEADNNEQLADAINFMLDNYTAFNKQQIRKIALDNFSAEAVLNQFTLLYKRHGIG